MKLCVGKYTIVVTNPDKILFPKKKIKKIQLVEYYQSIASVMLVHIKNRLLTLDRYPHGIEKKTFYQKDAPEFFPDYIKRCSVKKKQNGVVEYPVFVNEAAIVYLGNYVGVPHVWLSRMPKLNYPDRMIFDLDPAKGVLFSQVKWAAMQLKKVLTQLKLPSFIMTTGSRGVHVVVPIEPKMLFDDVRSIAYDIAQYVVNQYPKKLTLEVRKTKRGKRIFVDTLRNAWSATSVAPYAVRACESAPIATPIEWEELSHIKTSQQFTLNTIMRRIAKKGDPWKYIAKKAIKLQRIKKALTLLKNSYF